MSKMLRRVLTVIPAAAVQALWILLLVKWLSPYAAYITLALSVAAVLLVLFIIIKRDETAYKNPVAALDPHGTGRGCAAVPSLRQQAHGTPAAKAPAPRAGGRAAGSAPPAAGRPSRGKSAWNRPSAGWSIRPAIPSCAPRTSAITAGRCDVPRHAHRPPERQKKTIYLEYFIIEPGEMWQSIVDILAQKVREGLDARDVRRPREHLDVQLQQRPRA